jgi:hypothetical protein
VFRLSSSLTLVAVAFARGSRAFCHHVRVRALGAIMCAWHCLQTLLCRQSDHRSPSPRALCRRDDSTWSIPRRAPSRPAFHRTLQHATEPNFTFVYGLRRGCSGGFVIVIASLFAAATVVEHEVQNTLGANDLEQSGHASARARASGRRREPPSPRLRTDDGRPPWRLCSVTTYGYALYGEDRYEICEPSQPYRDSYAVF